MKNLRTPEDLANKAQEISNNLQQFTGTEAYYRYSPLFPFMFLTDGIKELLGNKLKIFETLTW